MKTLVVLYLISTAVVFTMAFSAGDNMTLGLTIFATLILGAVVAVKALR